MRQESRKGVKNEVDFVVTGLKDVKQRGNSGLSLTRDCA